MVRSIAACTSKIVLTYPAEAGHPQFRADFEDWNLRPGTREPVFVFKPPAEADRLRSRFKCQRSAAATGAKCR